jgi:hypothetical protein
MKSIGLHLLIGSLLLFAGLEDSSAVGSYTGGTYSDNLDGLGSSSGTWTNDSTLPGWYAYESNGGVSYTGYADDQWGPIASGDYQISIGQQNWGVLNLGTDNTSPNRSLGSKNSGWDIVFALVLQNNTAVTYTGFTLSYYGEQWQINALQFDPSQKLSFSYGVFSSFNTSPNNPNTIVPFNASNSDISGRFYTGYTQPAGNALDMSAFQFGSTDLPLNGNDPANRQLISSTQSASWAPGQYLVLRWLDDNTFGEPQAMLAVNDIQLTGQGVPEPSCAALLLLGSAGLGLLRNRVWLDREPIEK